jgi:hypothetical protein
MHVKCIYDLWTLPLDIPPYLHHILVIFMLFMIIGNNSHVPQFYWINLEKSENLYFNVFNFQGPKQSPNYLKLCGSQIFHGTRLWSEGSATGDPRGPNEHGPRGQIPRPHGASPFPPCCSNAINFIMIDSSWPKTDYIKGAPASHERSAAETQKHKTGAWEIEDRRGKL